MKYDQRVRDFITALGTVLKTIRADITGLRNDVNAKQGAIGFTPEDASKKGAAGGYASLDNGGRVPASQLPSYVDDVLEYANVAAFPANGESGKLYIAADTDKEYRWSGTAYRVIVASPGTTDAVVEGTTNLYFTPKRAQDALEPLLGNTDADLVALLNAALA